MAIVMLFVVELLAPVFLYAQAHYTYVELGTNPSNAAVVADTAMAAVTEGDENYFRIEPSHLPATVYYKPTAAFGPIPMLIDAITGDTIPSVMVVEQCISVWQWSLAEKEDVRCFYFSSHEEQALAGFLPYMCQPARSSRSDVTACDDYYWEEADTVIYTSGNYAHVFRTAKGCDSIVTQKVNISQSTQQTVKVTAYDSYTWINGTTYTSSIAGPSWSLTNIAGCDSTLTLDLTIRHMLSDTLRVTMCSDELPYSWRGKTLTEGGIFSSDTLLGPAPENIDTAHALVLTVHNAYHLDTTAQVCGNDFTWRGHTYTQSGDYTISGKTLAYCDSVMTLHLTLGHATSSEETRTEYDSYEWNGQIYTQSGDYTYQTTNVSGCDSIATLHLTIIPRPIVTDTVVEYFCPKSGIIEHMDATGDPVVIFKQYGYEKPNASQYMEGVISGETERGANVNFSRVLANLDAYYVTPLTPVEAINWRYMPEGGEYQTIEVGEGAQWVNTGTLSMDVVFRCGYRYYGSFEVGMRTEGMSQTKRAEHAVKRIENGQMVIIRAGVKYNVLGTKIE